VRQPGRPNGHLLLVGCASSNHPPAVAQTASYAQRRQNSSNSGFQDFVAASECSPMSVLKVQRSAMPKMVADCIGVACRHPPVGLDRPLAERDPTHSLADCKRSGASGGCSHQPVHGPTMTRGLTIAESLSRLQCQSHSSGALRWIARGGRVNYTNPSKSQTSTSSPAATEPCSWPSTSSALAWLMLLRMPAPCAPVVRACQPPPAAWLTIAR